MFKSWFIDFEPFGGKIPDDWKVNKLQESASEVIRGFTSKYVEKSNLINLNQKVNKGPYLEKQYYKFLDESISVPKEKFARKKDILLNSLGQGTLGRIHFWYETSANVVIDQHITIIRAKKGVTTAEYLYLLLSSSQYTDYFESCITGTTGMLMLNISAVRNADIMLPTIEIQEKFTCIVGALYEKISQNNQENTCLAQLRDTLLPKLMSGEIDVSKVNISADKLSFILLFIQSDQPELKVTSQEKSDPIITLVFIGFWDIPDQPEFLCFARNMARLASPHMNYRQEGPVGIFTPSKGVTIYTQLAVMVMLVSYYLPKSGKI